jgi:hypothetical protein
MKKAVYLSLVAILIVLGFAKSEVASAQGNGNTGLVDRTFPMVTTEAYLAAGRLIPIECDGVVIDHLSGTLDVFCRMFGHYDPLNPNVFVTQWMIHNYSGFLVGVNKEVFEIQGVKKIDSIDKVYTIHLNIKGDKGSHYIIIASGNTSPYSFIIEKAVCPSSSDQ